MQPAHLLTDIPLVERHWGARGRGAYAFETLRRRGTPMVFGSDVPVASLDPREGLFAALERRSDAGAPGRRVAARGEARLRGGGARLHRWARRTPAGVAGARRHAGAGPRRRSGRLVDFDPAAERGAGDAVRAGRRALTVVGGEVVMQR